MIKFNDVELTIEEVEAMFDSEDSFSVEIKTPKSDKKPMQKLNYRFSSSISKECESLSIQLDAHNQSDIARAAMAIGLHKLKTILEKEGEKQCSGHVHIGKMRHDNGFI